MKVAPALTMGVKGSGNTCFPEIIMTLNTKFAFMTLITELLVSVRCNRMGDAELGAVNIGHGVSEVAHLISPTGLMAVETIILFVTGGAINALGDRGATMVQRPGHVVRQ